MFRCIFFNVIARSERRSNLSKFSSKHKFMHLKKKDAAAIVNAFIRQCHCEGIMTVEICLIRESFWGQLKI